MKWKKNTIIKDAVHGYISIPKPIMREIIDSETFQRLKNIEQTGMEGLVLMQGNFYIIINT